MTAYTDTREMPKDDVVHPGDGASREPSMVPLSAAEIVEAIARQWDGCTTELVGIGEIDTGATIRQDGVTPWHASVVPAAPSRRSAENAVTGLMSPDGVSPAPAPDLAALLEEAREALIAARDEIEGGICFHYNRHRGGAIWTICDDCGQKWADDRGGFQKPTMPKAYLKAQAAISRIDAVRKEKP